MAFSSSSDRSKEKDLLLSIVICKRRLKGLSPSIKGKSEKNINKNKELYAE
jgi:hypothetical protein